MKLGEINNLDSIVLTREIYNTIMPKLHKDRGSYRITGTFKEGVIKIKNYWSGKFKDKTMYVYFNEKEPNIVELKSFINPNGKLELLCSFNVDYSNCDGNIEHVYKNGISNFNIGFMGSKTNGIGRIEMKSNLFGFYTMVMLYINSNIANAKRIEKEVAVTTNKSSKSKSKSTTNSNKRNEIFINDIVIRTYKDKLVTQKREINRHAESWNVRGHERHYKSGKIVYVKPHKKGEGKLKTKDYTISI